MRKLTLLLLLCLHPLGMYAQRPLSDDYYLFETSEAVRVNAFVQDTTGFMWLGTEKGLYRFNGQGDISAIYSTIHKEVTALALIENRIYVGCANGAVGYVVADTMVVLPLSGARPTGAIHDIFSDGKDVIWLGTSDGLFAVAHHSAIALTTANGLPDNLIHGIARAIDGDLLVGTANGISKIGFDKGKLRIRNLNTREGLPDHIVRVLKRAGQPGQFWVPATAGI